jgi:hypothetical protein
MRRRPKENIAARRLSALGAALTAAVIIGFGLPAVFPDLAQLASPFVCAGQKLTTTSSRFTGTPGVSGTTIVVECVDAAGDRTPAPTIFVAAIVTAELAIPFAIIAWWVSAQVWPSKQPVDDDDDDDNERRRRRDDDD